MGFDGVVGAKSAIGGENRSGARRRVTLRKALIVGVGVAALGLLRRRPSPRRAAA